MKRSNLKNWFFAVFQIVLFPNLAISEDVFTNKGGWGESSGGLKLRATLDSVVVNGGPISIEVDILVDHNYLLPGSYLNTNILDAIFVLKVCEETRPIHRNFFLIPKDINYPNYHIALDTIKDSARIGTITFSPFRYSWDGEGRAEGTLLIQIPSSTAINWSGEVSSAPFTINVIQPPPDLREIKLAVWSEYKLAEGPSVVVDSEKIDTVTVKYNYGFYLTEYIRQGGFETAQLPENKTENSGAMDVGQIVQYSFRNALIRPIVFLEGKKSLGFNVQLAESRSKPEWYHGIHFNGQYNIIWQDTIRLVINKKELEVLQKKDAENFYHISFKLPEKFDIKSRREISFSEDDLKQYEFEIKKGFLIGHYTIVNNGEINCYEGFPNSPVPLLLPRWFSNDVEQITLGLYQYEEGKFKKVHDRSDGPLGSFWMLGRNYDRYKDTIAFSISDKTSFARRRLRHWWHCELPRELILASDSLILFDSTDMMSLDYNSYSEFQPTIRITFNDSQPKFFDQPLHSPLKMPDYDYSMKDSIVVQIDIVVAHPSDALTARSTWSKTYNVSAAVKP